ncbi:hypothetical protein [Actinomadura sp. 6N118]|uniref:hypothetical protein n=1 Tax=Actinomadura sp. 6N118 TaxID=3375151 RepID=UPI0037AF8AF0
MEVPAEAEPGRSQWVDMGWQGVLGWAVATGLFVYFTVGLTVVAIVMVIVAGEVGAAAGMVALALVCGLVSWPLVRMAPRYSTRQGFLADGTGITLVQEPKRWFPGRNAHIPWPQVHRVRQDRIVVSGGNGRTVHYVIDIELRDPLRDAGLPTWAAFDGDKVRIRSRKTRQAEIVRALRATRPDLLPDA